MGTSYIVHVKFLPFCTREIILLLSLPTYQNFCKEVYSKRKELAPPGSKFIPFRIDPFTEGGKIYLE